MAVNDKFYKYFQTLNEKRIANRQPPIGELSYLSVLDLTTAYVTGTLQAAQLGAFTGDVQSIGGTYALTLPNINANVGTFNNLTINAKGQVTAATNVAYLTTAVTSVAMTGDGVIFNSTVPGSPITTTGTLAPALLTQAANVFLAGPTTGSAAAPTFRALVGADLPNPSATTLGGVRSAAAVSNQWIDSISTSGVPHLSQPAIGDISGFGTGVATALAVNIGTAGAFVVNGGALGTPSSGVATNLTGTASGLTTGAATALATARTIGGVSFDGTANIVPQTIQSVNEATDTTCFPLFISASGSQSLQPLNNTALTFNASTGALGATSFSGAGTGLTGTAASLTAGSVTTNANLTGPITSVGNATSIASQTGTGTKFVVDNTPTIISPVISTGLTASGSASNDFSGSTGTFKTSSGANQLSGAVTISDATTPSLTTASGKTNTGFVQINGKTSGALKIIAADAAAQTVTLSLAAQTVGAATLTIPNMANVNKTVAWLESPSFTTPALGAATYTTLSGGAITNSALTAGRVTFAGTAGLLSDDADFTFSVDTLTITKIAATSFTGAVTLSDVNLVLGTTTGTKIGTATSQKLSFYNSTPIVQPTGDVKTALTNLGLVGSPTITADTNANLTGVITSVGNATSIASQTGTGTKFVVDTSPTLVTPNIGVASGTSVSLTALSKINATTGNHLPTAQTGVLLQLANADATACAIELDTFGSVAAQIIGVCAGGTAAIPSASQSDDILMNIQAYGYGASAYSTANRVRYVQRAAENWTASAQGTYHAWFTTATGGTTTNEKMRLIASGCLGVNNTTDTGIGTVNANTAYYIAGTKVIGARDTGWTAMTGSSDKATSYATSTVTLAQLAGRVMAMQAALTTHGILGA